MSEMVVAEAQAEAWADRVEVQTMVESLTQVFEKWADDALLSRFRQQVMAVIQQAYIEGQIASAPPVGEGWQPIETAPKDGTRFLAFVAELEAVDFVQWQERHGSPVGWRDSFIRVYRDNDAGGPTHWMPLPRPPVSSGEA